MSDLWIYADDDSGFHAFEQASEVLGFAYSRVCPEGAPPINIELSVDSDVDPEICTGFCTPESVNEGVPLNYDIDLAPDLDSDTLTQTLIHETVHIAQYLRGDLYQGHGPEGGKFRITWKGEDHTNTEYHLRPWESEAKLLESQIYEEYKELN
jgi:hypothetical protein